MNCPSPAPLSLISQEPSWVLRAQRTGKITMDCPFTATGQNGWFMALGKNNWPCARDGEEPLGAPFPSSPLWGQYPGSPLVWICIKWAAETLQRWTVKTRAPLGTARARPELSQLCCFACEPSLPSLLPRVVSCQVSSAFLLIPAVSSWRRPGIHSNLWFFSFKGPPISLLPLALEGDWMEYQKS